MTSTPAHLRAAGAHSRRRSGLVALAAAASIALAGCAGASAEDEGAAATGDPTPGGTVTFAVENEPASFNPHVENSHKAKVILRNVFDSYLFKAEDGTYHPWLAESFEIDDTSITLTLRDDVTFHDGEALDADAVVVNFDRLRDGGYSPGAAFLLQSLEDVEATGPLTVEFTLTRPDTLFVDFLSSVSSAPLSPAAFEEDSLEAGGPAIAGTGPFVLTDYAKGQEATLERFEDYDWAPEELAEHDGPALLDGATFRFLPEDATRTGALSSEQVDVIEGVPSVDATLFDEDEAFTYGRVLNNGTPYTYYLNVAKPPFDDLRVRRAFVQAVDVDTLLTAVHHGAVDPATTAISSASTFHDSAAARPGYDVEAANALLDEAGWSERDGEGYRVKNGERLTAETFTAAPFIRDNRDTLAQAVAAQLKENVGIELRYEQLDLGSSQSALGEGEHTFFDNSYGTSEPVFALSLLYETGGLIAYGNYEDPVLDELIESLSATTDPAEQADLYSEFQAHVTENAYALPLYNTQETWAALTGVHGITTDPALGTVWSLYNVWKDEK